jgi:hypothetical protein
MSKWVEIEGGEVGVHVPTGKFFMLGETELVKVHEIQGDTVYVLNGSAMFKISQVRLIETGA